MTKSYERVDADGSRYLLGDLNGLLHLLVIAHSERKGYWTKNLRFLVKTSVASTISYLDNAFVYVGSSYGDFHVCKHDHEFLLLCMHFDISSIRHSIERGWAWVSHT